MCSDSVRPIAFQERPPSRLRYTPLPQPTWRPLTFSPVPTQTTSGLVGSSVTSPIEYEGWSSKIGVHVMPALVVFHRPPEPTATYQVLRVGVADLDVGDAAAHDGGPDLAHAQRRDGGRYRSRGIGGLLVGLRIQRSSHGNEQEKGRRRDATSGWTSCLSGVRASAIAGILTVGLSPRG